MKIIVLITLLVFAGTSWQADTWKHICTNSKDPAKLNKKDYMAEFAKGPCSPMMLVPGLTGSILQVMIDCKTLQSSDPTTFASCGWNSCGKSQGGLESVPDKEYVIWVPDVFSPMSIITEGQKSKDCWAGLLHVTYQTVQGKTTVVSKPGVTVRARGLTPETQGYKATQCGTKSIENLLGETVINPEATQYFKAIIDRLLDMGYQSGLTMQSMPYDFRMSSGVDAVSLYMSSTIKQMAALNNKKVIIVAHSFGNSKTMYTMWNMSQADKDANVALYMAVAPPWLGVLTPTKDLTCGDDGYSFAGIGLDMKTFKEAVGTFPVGFELSPATTYTSQASQPWMQKILNRIKYENGQSSDPVFDFLPLRDAICYPKFNDKKCVSGLQDFSHFGTYMGSTQINASNLHSWVNQYTYETGTSQAWDVVDPRFTTVPNINIPTVVVYSNRCPTEGIYNFSADPRTYTSQNKFCPSSVDQWTPMMGDETVPSTSSVTVGLKWAMDFQNKVSGAKPIKFVDVCSEFNVKLSPYDSKSGSGQEIMSKLEYSGMVCDCSQGKYKHCTHEGILFLQAWIDFASKTALSNDMTSTSAMVNSMTEQQLEAYQNNCVLYNTLNGPSEAEQVAAE